MTVTLHSSLTRTSDLAEQPFDIATLPKDKWSTGDFVVGEITGPGTLVCSHCGQQVQFQTTSKIPQCPNCQQSSFKRADK